ncbi:MAG: alkaline phosphatase [Rheinheimera sp.]|uniref:alkaline phosphatase n=1 Tax=Arsukibacterium sp. UBA3155 TaxID=1946058 RepID=UPI000C96E5B3|nr:alkaline phosphatase [Arsukibacterium sp. UBA3155]MAD76178.1 alkaline phosphatase [Rheinheimera sp.]|tara:strand:- start:81172 stop:82476 length:1305 start_codon:yes stop_codon:yes gene_type:complete
MRSAFLFVALASLLPLNAIAAPKNIIYMIGDGMGPSYVAAYRYYQHDPAKADVVPTVFDALLTGMASTYPDDDTLVTDSAAGATALATGVKSYNGAISVNRQHIPIGTMMQLAKRLGKTNGIVASSQVNHATPASFLAHSKSRRNMNDIADMYLDYRIDGMPVADLIIGGGSKYFAREDRNLIAGFSALGYQYTDDYAQLDQITRLPALALLSEDALPAALNSDVDNILATLTGKALQLLSGADNGFVLMVEGSQIDWCGHDNDIACAMAEMHDFAKAIEVARAYVDTHPDTLLIITADHETGGLSMGANGIYQWRTEVIQKVKATGRAIAKQLQQLENQQQISKRFTELTGLTLDKAQLNLLLQALKDDDEKVARSQILQFISDASLTGWTSSGHTAADVPVMAYGKQAGEFTGFMDNTAIAKKLIQYIQQTQ